MSKRPRPVTVRIVAVEARGADAGFRIESARDGKPLFGGRRFPDLSSARRYLAEANRRGGDRSWAEARGARLADQLPLFP